MRCMYVYGLSFTSLYIEGDENAVLGCILNYLSDMKTFAIAHHTYRSSNAISHSNQSHSIIFNQVTILLEER